MSTNVRRYPFYPRQFILGLLDAWWVVDWYVERTYLRDFKQRKSLPVTREAFLFQTKPPTTYLVTLNVAVLLVVPVRAVMTLVLVAV